MFSLCFRRAMQTRGDTPPRKNENQTHRTKHYEKSETFKHNTQQCHLLNNGANDHTILLGGISKNKFDVESNSFCEQRFKGG